MEKKIISKNDLIKVDDYIWEIPSSFRADMRVPARIFLHENMIDDILHDRSLEQLINVATLPGIQKYAYAMPDIHQGYGFPIGGVAAMAIDQGGIISPGGIGYDINCGVRLLVSNKEYKKIKPKLEDLATALFQAIPSGVGRGGNIKMSEGELNKVLLRGAQYMVEKGWGTEHDLEYCEERGNMAGGDPGMISDRAKNRGADQLGTLGSGNHFLEIQKVEQIYNEEAAHAFGLYEDAVTVMIHCGSRGLGHQTCTDHVKSMVAHSATFGITLPDRELVCAPFHSQPGQDYFSAMIAAANFAWANRHLIAHWTRQAFQTVAGSDTTLSLVYDVSHNIGKIEEHLINDKKKSVIMHRKGATRAFGPHSAELPAQFQRIGQPVLIPGTMGTASYVLNGTSAGMDIAFGSSCHGAGRQMSRAQAKREIHGATLREHLHKKGIIIRCESNPELAEEAPQAYKNIDNVIEVVHETKIAQKVARLIPLAVIKGG